MLLQFSLILPIRIFFQIHQNHAFIVEMRGQPTAYTLPPASKIITRGQARNIAAQIALMKKKMG